MKKTLIMMGIAISLFSNCKKENISQDVVNENETSAIAQEGHGGEDDDEYIWQEFLKTPINDPIEYGDVWLTNGDTVISAVTDAQGKCTLGLRDSGSYILHIEAAGFLLVERVVSVYNTNTTSTDTLYYQ